MPSGAWFPMPSEGWPEVVSAMLPTAKPWPRWAVVADLEWYANEVRRGRRPKVPGRRALRKRWGWTDWATRSAMREVLGDSPGTIPEPSRPPPASNPAPTQEERSKAENGAQTNPVASRLPPASNPVSSRLPPQARGENKNNNHKEEPQEEDTQPAKPAAPPSEPPADANPVPAWATKAARRQPVTASEVLAGCVQIVEAMRLSRRHRDGCSPTKAKPILALWRALEHPEWPAFVEDVALVVDAAQRCPDPLFARSIRAEGWADGTDRRGDLDTILRHTKWDARLEAAERWRDGGYGEGQVVGAAPVPPNETPAQKFFRESRERRAARARLEVINGGEG